MPKIPPDQLPPEHLERHKFVSVSPTHPAINIAVIGHRDRRGADNNIRVWLDENDHLHIRVEKAQRCYSFAKLIDMPGYVELIQE